MCEFDQRETVGGRVIYDSHEELEDSVLDRRPFTPCHHTTTIQIGQRDSSTTMSSPTTTPTTTSTPRQSIDWGQKIHTKLSSLQEKSSKESHQTVAQWIVFHRRRMSESFLTPLQNNLRERPQSTLSVIHALFHVHKKIPEKWEPLAPLRLEVAQNVIMEAAPAHSILQPWLEQWDSQQIFAGSNILQQIRETAENPSASTTTAGAERMEGVESQQGKPGDSVAATTATEDPTHNDDIDMLPPDDNDDEDPTPVAAQSKPAPPSPTHSQQTTPSPSKKTTSSSSKSAAAASVPYDFEATGIAQRSVAPREFMDACKAVATLQITRDLQTDTVARLSSLLQALPPDIVATTTKDPSSIPKLASSLDPALLELGIDEQAATVRLYRDVVTRQHTARTALLHLLQASRCQFGSKDVAESYLKASSSNSDAPWKDQAHALSDALELEGLEYDTVVGGQRAVPPTAEPPSLVWYDDSSSKRQKTEAE